MEKQKIFFSRREKKENIYELMFSLYRLPTLCGTYRQSVWVSELNGLYKFIGGNGWEERRELEVLLKRLFLPEAQGHAVQNVEESKQ